MALDIDRKIDRIARDANRRAPQAKLGRSKLTAARWLLLLLTLALASCGGRGETPSGALTLDIFGLPAGVSASVEVVGQDGFSRTLTQSQTLTALTPGSYVVTAANVSGYTPRVTGSPAQVRAGATAEVSVSYREVTDPGPGGSISGTVSVVGTVPVGVAGPRVGGEPPTAPFVPGEVIVKFRGEVRPLAALASSGFTFARPVGNGGAQLLRAPGLQAAAQVSENAQVSAGAQSATLEFIEALQGRADVLYAHPNYLLSAYAEPNDPLYREQWHYRAINLPAAWDLTTGSSEVTVAVLDSGIATGHPDFAGKLRPGYNFVDDGSGRSDDSTDPGGNFHGSHVAGTVGAATDNGVGVAGVSWGARILPVRVLGGGSGTLTDAIDGILWSAGLEVADVPNNPNPAQVLNLSLGGPFLCSDVPALQEAFDQVTAAGAVVVTAAGNEDTDARNVTPASCGGVLAVGATDVNGERAYYSNYGPRIDVMAPGGDLDQSIGGNPAGVLSTVRDSSGEDSYGYLDGTSMAAPHVAGLLALMKSLRPGLSGPQALDILKRTARPISGGSCSVGCGAGLIDAEAALRALQTPAEPTFSLSLSPGTVTLSAGDSESVAVMISRAGFDGEVSLSVQGAPNGLGASFSPQTTSGSSSTLSLNAAAGLEGSYTLQVRGVGGGVARTATLSVFVEQDGPIPNPTLDVQGTRVYACPVASDICTFAELPSVEITESGSEAPYTLGGLPAGGYRVVAWNDLDGDGVLDSGEPFGVHQQNGEVVTVVPPVDAVDLVMLPAVGTQGSGVRLGR